MPRNRRKSSAWNIHPGEILRVEFLAPMKITSYQLAKCLQIPVPRIHDIVLEKRGITADTAIRLARYFGTTEEFWMNLQTSFEVRRAKARLTRSIHRIAPYKKSRAAWHGGR